MTKRKRINWDLSAIDAHTISVIAERAVKMASGTRFDDREVRDWFMDVSATHNNGCPLRLREFAFADDVNFGHDIFGIAAHLNRETGELEGCFLPRFAKGE